MGQFRIGQRLRFAGGHETPVRFTDVNGLTYWSPPVKGKFPGGLLCDVVMLVDGTAHIDVHIRKDGEPGVAKLEVPWNDGDLNAQFESVRGKPYVIGYDDRRREGTNPVEGAPEEEPQPGIDPKVLKIAEALAGLGGAGAAPLDEPSVIRVVERIAAERGWGQTPKIVVEIGGAQHVIEGVKHQIFDPVLKHMLSQQPVMVVGPAGAGKTTLGTQLCDAIFGPGKQQTHFAELQCTQSMTEDDWVGTMTPNFMGGTREYIGTDFVRLYEHGGVFIADEMDNTEASVMVRLNGALDNGRLKLPNGEYVYRHPQHCFAGFTNTIGHGASRMYVGRAQQDAAFLDRFVLSTFEIDYDKDLEALLVPEEDLRSAFQAVRAAVADLKLRHIVSTRALCRARVLREPPTSYEVPQLVNLLMVGWPDANKQAVRAAAGVAK